MSAAWRIHLLALLGVVAVLAATPSQGGAIVDATGPIAQIHVSRVLPLDCQVMVAGINYAGIGAESDGEFWGNDDPTTPNACGTYLRVGSTTYGPNVGGYSCPANCANPPPVEFTPVLQSLGGNGSAASPWRLVTQVQAGPLVDVVQTDEYASGRGHFTTSIEVTNRGPSSSFVLYRAGDCYLQDFAMGDSGDMSYGFLDPFTQAAGCAFQPNVLEHHFIVWFPVSATRGTVAGQEGHWNVIWTRPGQGLPMTGSCLCAANIDSGGGISWSFTLDTGESATFVSRNGFVLEAPPPPPDPLVGYEVPQPPAEPVLERLRNYGAPRPDFLVASTCDGVMLDGGASWDPDGTVDSWEWSINGSRHAGRIHFLLQPVGPLEVRLTVRDDTGQYASSMRSITWTPCPTPQPPQTATAPRRSDDPAPAPAAPTPRLEPTATPTPPQTQATTESPPQPRPDASTTTQETPGINAAVVAIALGAALAWTTRRR